MSALHGKILNLLLYQFGWFCCVLGAAWGYPLQGALLAILLTAAHLCLVEERRSELRVMLLACMIGALVDSLQQAFGLLRFRGAEDWPLWLPLWVFVIWAQFATLFRFALHWLRGRTLLAAVLGAVGGPIAYWSGVRFGAAEFGGNPTLSLAVLVVVWGGVTPLLLHLSQHLNPREGRYLAWAGLDISRRRS